MLFIFLTEKIAGMAGMVLRDQGGGGAAASGTATASSSMLIGERSRPSKAG
jgi:hypothetical protein